MKPLHVFQHAVVAMAAVFVLTAVLVLAGCKDKTYCITTEYTIVNQIDSDIVVELKSDGKPAITIAPGETKMFHTGVQCNPEGVVPSMPIEVLYAEMRIDGEVVPERIWWRDYWNATGGTVEQSNMAYTLTVTDEFLDSISNL